jgi:hypothetical protein
MAGLTSVESSFEFLEALFVLVEPGFLFEVDAKQCRQERILMVQQAAGVGVLAGILE